MTKWDRGRHRAAAMVLAASALFGFSTPAAAAPITRTFDFNASVFGVGAPVDPVIGSITITHDPTLYATDETTGIVLNSLNIALGSAIGFTYFAASDQLFVGGMAGGVGDVASGNDDFALFFEGAFFGPINLPNLAYSTSASDQNFFSAETQVTIGSIAVTEPAAAAMLACGLVTFGAMRRRRREGSTANACSAGG